MTHAGWHCIEQGLGQLGHGLGDDRVARIGFDRHAVFGDEVAAEIDDLVERAVIGRCRLRAEADDATVADGYPSVRQHPVVLVHGQNSAAVEKCGRHVPSGGKPVYMSK